VTENYTYAPTPRVAELLDGYPLVLPIRVAWGEMDSFKHVNNAVFFRYFETVRFEFVTRMGWARDGSDGEVGPILHSTSARFRRPLFYPDVAWTGCRASELGEDRFLSEYRVVSEAQGEVVAEGSGLIVAYDYGIGAKARLPDAVRARIEATIRPAGG
jgi:acyl-CoA thioester hydrolase